MNAIINNFFTRDRTRRKIKLGLKKREKKDNEFPRGKKRRRK